MTVIAFPTVRFSPDDVALFDRISAPMLRRGLWESVRREATPAADRLVVRIPDVPRPLFAFERLRGGRYRLTLHEKDGAVYEIGHGWTARECLRIWLRHAEAAAADGERPAV
jgi:hypothetical protein